MDKIHSAVSTLFSDMASTESSILPQLWMQKRSLQDLRPPLSDTQRTSLSAMIGYISHKSGQSEFRIERRLSDHFNIPNAKCLMANDFDAAIRYLADIVSM